jgi:hypothetical protein
MKQSTNPPMINLLVALHCEAQPFIEAFKLRKVTDSVLSHYSGQGQLGGLESMEINLVETGIGQLNMATAVGWLGARTARRRIAWLNVGTAGHTNMVVGTAVRIARCASESQERVYYPPLVATWPVIKQKGSAEITSRRQLGEVLTGNTVCTDYPPQALVDMEAYAFFRSATKFSPAELVQSIKVVSDNTTSDVSLLDAKKLTEIMSVASVDICGFADSLVALANRLPERAIANAHNLKHLNFTVSQNLQFEDYYQKLINLGMSEAELKAKIMNSKNSKQLLAQMRSVLLNTAPALD